MPLAETARDLARRVEHDREIGLALLGERRRQRDQDRVGLLEDVVVGCRVEPALVDEPPEQLGGDVLDVALAAEDLLDPALADVDQDDAATGVGEDLGEGKPHVAGADDRDIERANRRGRGGGGGGLVHGAESYLQWSREPPSGGRRGTTDGRSSHPCGGGAERSPTYRQQELHDEKEMALRPTAPSIARRWRGRTIARSPWSERWGWCSSSLFRCRWSQRTGLALPLPSWVERVATSLVPGGAGTVGRRPRDGSIELAEFEITRTEDETRASVASKPVKATAVVAPAVDKEAGRADPQRVTVVTSSVGR